MVLRRLFLACFSTYSLDDTNSSSRENNSCKKPSQYSESFKTILHWSLSHRLMVNLTMDRQVCSQRACPDPTQYQLDHAPEMNVCFGLLW